MNLGEIIDVACKLVGKTDDASKQLARTFAQRRYQSIYDSFAWRDAETMSTAFLPQGNNECLLPDGMDRVITIRASDNTFLDPVNLSLLIQTDPSVFERVGKPTSYREFITSGVRRIQVFPAPKEATTLLVVGKQMLIQLIEDFDVPVLRNIDNALVAFVEGDMLERARQFQKAQLKFTEANAALQAAQSLETNQSNLPRQSKVPGQGNSLAELADQVASVTGQWTPDSMVLIKNFLRSNYQAVWDALNWTEATVCATVNNDGPEVILPDYFDRVLAVRFNPGSSALEMVGPDVVFGVNPLIFEQTGTPGSFSYLTSVGVAFLPLSTERLTLNSSSAKDDGNVFISGESEGSMVSENVVLNGTRPVKTRYLYNTPLTISKTVTAGDVLVFGFSSGAELQRIPAAATEKRHMRIWVQPAPSAAQVCLVLGKRTINPFVQDEDTTLLRGIGATLIASSAADMFMRLGNDKASMDQRKQAKEALQALITLETQQGAFNARVLPSVEYPYGEYDVTWGSGMTKSGVFY